MPRVIVIQLDSDKLRAVVARPDAGTVRVDHIAVVPVEGDDLTVSAKSLASELEAHHPQKAEIVVAVPSSSIKWQYLTLPPSPQEDLPALVQMQLDLDASRDEELIGYDFLPFVGGDDRPQRLLAMILKVAELARVRSFSRLSGLKVNSVVPIAMGWMALGDAVQSDQQGTNVFVALHNSEATIWIKVDGQVALVRQVQVPTDSENNRARASVLAQVRRSLMNLAQEGVAAEGARVYLLGDSPESLLSLTESLRELFADGAKVLKIPDGILRGQTLSAEVPPLLGLAWEATLGNSPQLDFLHPRKPPEPKSNTRTYILAAVAAMLVAALVGWQGYANLYGPLWRAEKLEEELHLVNQQLRPLEAEERDAARIRDWLDASPNVLTELADIARDWRPEPFDSPEFSLEKDAILKRIDINGRRIVITGNVPSNSAVQPLENRLRDSRHRVRRELSEADTEGGKYPWRVQIAVDVVDDSGAETVEGGS